MDAKLQPLGALIAAHEDVARHGEYVIKVAIAHDYLTQRGGAERVVLSLLKAFPGAELHTTLYAPSLTYPEFSSVPVRTSRLNAFSALRRNHRLALPLLASATKRMRIDADVVVASSSGWAHGVQTSGKKLVYCHTPARWLYEREEYLGLDSGSITRAGIRALTPPLLRWDRRAAESADRYLANARVAQERISRAYGLKADILHPPYSVDPGGNQATVTLPQTWGPEPAFYLVVSRLMAYKNVASAVGACKNSGRNLVVVGKGPERDHLISAASGRALFLEDIDDTQLRWLYAHARGLIAASHEDFGLTPVEAAAFGTPTVALRAGGYLETVIDGTSGLFFSTPNSESISHALSDLEARRWPPEVVKATTGAFEEEHFIERIRSEVRSLLAS
jgi:glycosyltransferase involved in cell wall biosynthesis